MLSTIGDNGSSRQAVARTVARKTAPYSRSKNHQLITGWPFAFRTRVMGRKSRNCASFLGVRVVRFAMLPSFELRDRRAKSSFKTRNNCPSNFTVQDGLCKPYRGPAGETRRDIPR